MDYNKILVGDALEKLRELPDESVHCCVTSPPYWGLRDYGTASWDGGELACDHLAGPAVSKSSTLDGGKQPDVSMPFNGDCGKCGAKRIDSQLGLEKTPEEYVAKMVEVFREVRRVLRKDGICWINLGDSYATEGTAASGEGKEVFKQRGKQRGYNPSSNFANYGERNRRCGNAPGLKPKDLCGIPWRVAFALQSDGWYLRQDIIWAKPNPMPESVTDRCTKAHEYLFLLTKSARYFYDAEAIKEPVSFASLQDGRTERGTRGTTGEYAAVDGNCGFNPNGRNKRSVWTVATTPYPEAHFATYPPDLIKPCIMAGTSAKGCCAKCGAPWERIVKNPDFSDQPKRQTSKDARGDRTSAGQAWQEWRNANPSTTIGWKPTCECVEIYSFEHGEPRTPQTIPCTVLDPFAGSGTTGAVAIELGRKAILIELNPKYVELIKRRCNITMGLALA